MSTTDMTAATEGEVAVLRQKLQRDINCLSDANHATRKKALDRLKRTLFGRDPPSNAVLACFFNTCLRRPLLTLFSDAVEKCRELSIIMVTEFASTVLSSKDNAAAMAELFEEAVPTIDSRFSPTPFPEKSEELRLLLAQLLVLLLKQEGSKTKLGSLFPTLVNTISKGLTDSFPDVKKGLCAVTALLVQSSEAAGLHEPMNAHRGALLKPLVANLSHQHAKVRITTLQVVGLLLPVGPAADEGAVTLLRETVMPSLKLAVGDRSPAVRAAVPKVLRQWLIGMGPHPSELQCSLLLLLLIGMSDTAVGAAAGEVPEVCAEAFESFKAVGEVWTPAAVAAAASATAPPPPQAPDMAVAAEAAEGDEEGGLMEIEGGGGGDGRGGSVL